MNGKKLYALIMVFMTLIAAFGIWVMIDGAVTYQERPRMEIKIFQHEVQSTTNPLFVTLEKK